MIVEVHVGDGSPIDQVELPQSHVLSQHAKECGTTSYECTELKYLDGRRAQYRYRCEKCGKRIDEPLQ